ncbi:MAG: VOC family protein, partial [Actinomycetota bacterium]|nr:VOC family protein [Actinomycetota bacterium]
TPDEVRAFRERLAADGVTIVEQWDEPDYVSVKCRDPDGYIVEGGWERDRRGAQGTTRESGSRIRRC